MKKLQDFDPRIDIHQNISEPSLSTLIRKVQVIDDKAVIFKSIESMSTVSDTNFEKYEINIIGKKISEKNASLSETDLMTLFLKQLDIPDQILTNIVRNTRDQSNCKLWFDMRKGRLTASNHHDIFTKMNSVDRAIGIIVSRILNVKETHFKTEATQWGINNEVNAFSQFYSDQFSHHENLKLEKCGLYIHKTKCYIAASPDGIVTCICHGKSTVEIKCPFKIKDVTISEGAHECNFLQTVEGKVSLLKSHKYYT